MNDGLSAKSLTNGSHSKQVTSWQMLWIKQNCPSCLNNRETSEHFLQCPHPIRQGIWEEFQQGLQKIYIKHNIPQLIQDITSEGYQLSRNPRQTTPPHIPHQISVQEVVKNQANLGWKQLIYRQFTSTCS